MSRVSAISCFETITTLMPCQLFLLGMGNSVTVPCCQGAESLSQLVSSHRDELKATCQCIKQAAAAMGVDAARAKQIPQLCNISVPVPIDPNVNCDRFEIK
ncbi:non-specific lipid-transfer protein cw18 [Phtheirospermum japonicum]|uniref:Non-specific lipid-transfer protein cw18 n=1 Tax=Phtheirospermum japonicum TaxID=374723 RepID=A0A830DA47_9LAMI|nr:non-specific lipid-transfer protein cw18 [Phtheirospermum japonicum]